MTDAVMLRAKGYDGNFVENSTTLQRVSSSGNDISIVRGMCLKIVEKEEGKKAG